VAPRFPSRHSLYRTCCRWCVFVKTNSFGSETSPRSRRAFSLATSQARVAPSGLPLRSNRDRRGAPVMRLFRTNRRLVPRQADFLFSQIRTDATLQACVYSGQIGAPCRVKRTSSSVKSGPTRCSRRAFTQAKSGPRAASSGLPLRSNQDRRDAPGVRLLRTNRGLVPRQADFLFSQIRTDATLQACVYSGQIGASCRVKRTFASVMTISDRLGPRAPNATRAQAVTYPTEGHLEDYAPLEGVA
jgi:hypothetical protein